MNILILILGLALILVGANLLTDGSSALAKRFGLSEFIIGLTIVAIGTSAPEFVVTIISSMKGNSDIAIGNVLGSNLFNTFIILGITALICPISLSSNQLKKDIPFVLLSSVVLFIVGCDIFIDNSPINIISRSEGFILLSMFVVFIMYSIYSSSSKDNNKEQDTTDLKKQKKMIVIIPMILLGLGGLIWGGRLFIDSAVNIASSLGISESMIAITLMAGGTSLPELAACAVAAYKKKGDLALGNVIGSNISNIFLILGTGASISPLTLGDITFFDLSLLVVSSILIFVTAFTFKSRRIDRTEAIIFIAIYIGYIFYLAKSTV